MTDDASPDLNQQIAARVRTLRATQGLTLDQLAQRSGVSKSMISSVERGESSPTAVLLERLATGLGVTLAALFNWVERSATPLSRRADQPEWRDPASGYIRRNVSPSGFETPIQIVDVAFPPGARVTYETGARDIRIHQQVWVQDGSIEVQVGEEAFVLGTGDCLAMVLDRPISFHNPTQTLARYAVIIVSQPDFTR